MFLENVCIFGKKIKRNPNNIEIIINNKDPITKISKLIKAVEQIIDINKILNPLLGLTLFLI